MQIFYENPVLTISQPGNDSTAGQRLRLTLNPIRVEELIRIWNAFPNVPLQPSVAYLVTPAEISPKA